MPIVDYNKFDLEPVVYQGSDMSKKWSKIENYGPKFFENITQAVARDVLMNSMLKLRNYRIVAHIHDELIIEVPEDTDMKTICDLMVTPPK